MTDEKQTSGTPETTTPDIAESAVPGSPANKAFWLGIGIGSAAVVAALMYATKRPKKRT